MTSHVRHCRRDSNYSLALTLNSLGQGKAQDLNTNFSSTPLSVWIIKTVSVSVTESDSQTLSLSVFFKMKDAHVAHEHEHVIMTHVRLEDLRRLLDETYIYSSCLFSYLSSVLTKQIFVTFLFQILPTPRVRISRSYDSIKKMIFPCSKFPLLTSRNYFLMRDVFFV